MDERKTDFQNITNLRLMRTHVSINKYTMNLRRITVSTGFYDKTAICSSAANLA